MTALFSVFIKPYTFSLEDQMQFAQYAGFDGVDYIATMSNLFSPPTQILHLSKKYNMKVKGVHIPLPLVVYTPNFLLSRVQKLLTYFPESENFNIHLSGFITQLHHNLQGLKTLQLIAEKQNVQLSCESNPDEYIIFKYYPKVTRDPDSFAKFCIKHSIPINLDTCHIASWGYDIVQFINKYHSYINLIHLSDMTKTTQHLPLGKGKLPIEEFLKELKKVRYKGSVVFEVSRFASHSKQDAQEEIQKNLNLFRKITHS